MDQQFGLGSAGSFFRSHLSSLLSAVTWQMWGAGWFSKTSAESFPLRSVISHLQQWSRLVRMAGIPRSQPQPRTAQHHFCLLLLATVGHEVGPGSSNEDSARQEEPQSQIAEGIGYREGDHCDPFLQQSASHLPDEMIYFNRNAAWLNHLAFRWGSQDLDQNSQTPELKLFITILSCLWVFQHQSLYPHIFFMVLVKGVCLLVEVQLIFNAMFITAVQQSEFDVCLCVCILLKKISFPLWLVIGY